MTNLRDVRFVYLVVRFVSLRFVAFRFVSFRFVSFRFASFRFVSLRFVSFRFVSFRFVVRFVSFSFVFVFLLSFSLRVNSYLINIPRPANPIIQKTRPQDKGVICVHVHFAFLPTRS
jgi:hypothetical protein